MTPSQRENAVPLMQDHHHLNDRVLARCAGFRPGDDRRAGLRLHKAPPSPPGGGRRRRYGPQTGTGLPSRDRVGGSRCVVGSVPASCMPSALVGVSAWRAAVRDGVRGGWGGCGGGAAGLALPLLLLLLAMPARLPTTFQPAAACAAAHHIPALSCCLHCRPPPRMHTAMLCCSAS